MCDAHTSYEETRCSETGPRASARTARGDERARVCRESTEPRRRTEVPAAYASDLVVRELVNHNLRGGKMHTAAKSREGAGRHVSAAPPRARVARRRAVQLQRACVFTGLVMRNHTAGPWQSRASTGLPRAVSTQRARRSAQITGGRETRIRKETRGGGGSYGPSRFFCAMPGHARDSHARAWATD